MQQGNPLAQSNVPLQHLNTFGLPGHAAWLARMAEHGNGVALIPARTETAMFYETVWGHAAGVLFLRSRPHFYYVDGRRAPFNSGAPIALVAYGRENLNALCDSGLGFVVVGHNT